VRGYAAHNQVPTGLVGYRFHCKTVPAADKTHRIYQSKQGETIFTACGEERADVCFIAVDSLSGAEYFDE
jgi:hypothetical protein